MVSPMGSKRRTRMKLIDRAKIYVKGGSGGKGCQSLFKDIFHRKGVPDGGNGGDGGDIILKSDTNLQTLLDFRYNQHFRAGNGAHGGSNNKNGKRGFDRVVKVPVGTIVKDAACGLVMRDLNRPGTGITVVRGGAGGKGNSGRRDATPGEPGEERTLVLDLKLIADAGVIGLPNAGKSTLVSRISEVHSKIAPYPFTTKSPRLGVVRFHDDSFVVADMPGLIEGAHTGRGLGDRFLRHIERTVILVHLVDMAPLDGSDPADNYFKIEKELRQYDESVADKPRIVVAGKMDLSDSGRSLERFRKRTGKRVLPVSAVKGDGLGELIKTIYGKIKDVKKEFEEDNGQDRDQGAYG